MQTYLKELQLHMAVAHFLSICYKSLQIQEQEKLYSQGSNLLSESEIKHYTCITFKTSFNLF